MPHLPHGQPQDQPWSPCVPVQAANNARCCFTWSRKFDVNRFRPSVSHRPSARAVGLLASMSARPVARSLPAVPPRPPGVECHGAECHGA
eukprot:3744654-Rhodomonas_salina.3